MKTVINQLDNMTLGEIAVQIPGATGVFRTHGLDFCCAGSQRFTEALDQKGLNRASIAQELEALTHAAPLPSDGTPGVDADDKTLTEYIVARFHNKHRAQFPELIRLASRVEQVHGAHDMCPRGLESHLTVMFDDLSLHMEKEETILFPMLCRGERAAAKAPMAMMEREHVSHGEALETIRTLTHDGDMPSHACNTWRALYRGLAQLEEDLIQHIHLENNILFAR